MDHTFNTNFSQSIRSSTLSNLQQSKFKTTNDGLNASTMNLLSPILKKPRLLDINAQKIKNKNTQLMRLFKVPPLKTFNTQNLQKSKLMAKNEIFKYLVNCLKKQRQGMIQFSPQNQKNKSSSLIQNRIRQFLYNSLQQSLLMSQKQIQQVNHFQRLFDWFTQVFKQRQMKLQFKKQSLLKKGSQNPDEDWIIRNNYKSNIPLEINNYQRKMLNMNQINQYSQRIQRLEEFKMVENVNRVQKSVQVLDKGNQSNQNKYAQKKAFTQTMNSSAKYKKSNELLPLLNRSNLFSNLKQLKKQKQQQEILRFKSQWKKQKSHCLQHSGKNFYNKKYKNDKILFNEAKFDEQTQVKQFKLTKNAADKINAARLGVTLTQFRKNKQNLKKQQCQNSMMFHPNLSSNYFYDIRKKKVQKQFLPLKKLKNPNQQSLTQKSQILPTKNAGIPQIQNQNQFQNHFNYQNDDFQSIADISGFGLVQNPFAKVPAKTKKK